MAEKIENVSIKKKAVKIKTCNESILEESRLLDVLTDLKMIRVKLKMRNNLASVCDANKEFVLKGIRYMLGSMKNKIEKPKIKNPNLSVNLMI